MQRMLVKLASTLKKLQKLNKPIKKKPINIGFNMEETPANNYTKQYKKIFHILFMTVDKSGCGRYTWRIHKLQFMIKEIK